MRILLCTKGCCPELAFSDDGETAMITADKLKDEVVVQDNTVGIRFTKAQLQMLVDELDKKGFSPRRVYELEDVVGKNVTATVILPGEKQDD